jgi:hypothetical protein
MGPSGPREEATRTLTPASLRTRTDIIVATIAAAIAVAAPLSAQDAHVRVEGTVESRIPSRSAQAARVSLVRMDQERSVTFTAFPDARGHYQLDTLTAGLYLVQVSDPTLDSLYLAPPSIELRLAPGKSVHADFLLPTAAELRASVCPGVSLGEGKAVVAGRAIDSDTDQPIAGAQVVAGWTELSFDKQSLKADSQKRLTSVSTGPTGDYRLCGVPTGHSLWIQLQHAGRAGAITRLSVGEEEGVSVRNISMSMSSAPTIAALDSVEKLAAVSSDTTMDGLDLAGTAIISGTVRRQSGQPLAGAQVRVRNAKSSATSDDAGHFTLRELPSGTQVMLVRSLGYGLVEIPVDLRPGRSVTQDAQLTRAAVLDSVKVVAKKPGLAEFEFNKRYNRFGKYMTASEIVRRDAKETGDLIRALGGFSVMGHGPNVKTFSKAAVAANPNCGEVNVVMGGVEGLSINDVDPRSIGGIEAYADNAFVPARYLDRGACGVIVIWLKPRKDPRPHPSVGLDYYGY